MEGGMWWVVGWRRSEVKAEQSGAEQSSRVRGLDDGGGGGGVTRMKLAVARLAVGGKRERKRERERSGEEVRGMSWVGGLEWSVWIGWIGLVGLDWLADVDFLPAWLQLGLGRLVS
jgi:hypothetical protein